MDRPHKADDGSVKFVTISATLRGSEVPAQPTLDTSDHYAPIGIIAAAENIIHRADPPVCRTGESPSWTSRADSSFIHRSGKTGR
jgi:hypothetical protein